MKDNQKSKSNKTRQVSTLNASDFMIGAGVNLSYPARNPIDMMKKYIFPMFFRFLG
jgi:hypothetical protein